MRISTQSNHYVAHLKDITFQRSRGILVPVVGTIVAIWREIAARLDDVSYGNW